MKNSKRIITENQAEIPPRGESSLAWHPSRHPTTTKWKAVWGGDRPQSCMVSGRSWVRLYEANHLAYLKSHFLPSFTHAHSRNKGKCFRSKVLGFFSPLTKGTFPEKGKGGQNKEGNKGLGTVYRRTRTRAQKCWFRIKCSPASPAGAAASGSSRSPGWGLWDPDLVGRGSRATWPRERKPRGQETASPHK